MSVFNSPSFDEHEQVVFCHNPDVGLSAIIAIHDRTLGPATGGCRMWPYESDEQALNDVLRLSRGMTYKSAMAGLALGGGKSVIIGDPRKDKSVPLMHALGEFIDSLSGRYWGAEDVGLTVSDLEAVAERTQYVAGLSKGAAASGDPSPFTAYGVFQGIKAAVKHRYKSNSLEGLKVSVQGLGSVGYHLCKHLHESGAKLVVSDINQDNIDRVVQEFAAVPVSPESIYGQNVDIFSPCALGAIINKETIAMIKAEIIAGASNNQLASDKDGQVLLEKGITYAPDYVINAGGIINVESEVLGRYDVNRVMQRVTTIYDTLIEIFERAQIENRPTNVVSDIIAKDRIKSHKFGKGVAA